MVNGQSTQGFQVVVAKSLDYEAKGSYSLVIDVTDGEMTVQSNVEVTVTDANDIRIDQVTWSPFPTAGGTTVRFTGSGLGTVWRTNSVSAFYSLSRTASASGRGSRLSYNVSAGGCTILTAPTIVECTTEPGFGEGLEWSLTVNGYMARANGVLTRYERPSISAVGRA